MTRTVTLVSRPVLDDETTADLTCDFIHVTVKDDLMEHGAGGSVQRSIQPTTLVIVRVNKEDFAKTRQAAWSHARWHDKRNNETVEHVLHRIEYDGTDFRLIF